MNSNLDSICTWEDYDYIGGDLWRQKSSSAEDCKSICNKYKECKRWTFVTSDSNGKCTLKKSNTTIPIYICDGCHTGFKRSTMQKCGLTG